MGGKRGEKAAFVFKGSEKGKVGRRRSEGRRGRVSGGGKEEKEEEKGGASIMYVISQRASLEEDAYLQGYDTNDDTDVEELREEPQVATPSSLQGATRFHGERL